MLEAGVLAYKTSRLSSGELTLDGLTAARVRSLLKDAVDRKKTERTPAVIETKDTLENIAAYPSLTVDKFSKRSTSTEMVR